MVQGCFVRLLAPHPFVKRDRYICEGYRRFESLFLQRRVWCEPGFGGCFGCLVLISQHPTTFAAIPGLIALAVVTVAWIISPAKSTRRSAPRSFVGRARSLAS
jgi:hypothetical protein